MHTEIKISKNLAVEEAGELRNNMLLLIKEGKKDFILDFHQCDFIDSTGLGVLVAIYKKAAENGGSIKLKNLNAHIIKLFKLTRLDRVFEIS